MASEEFMIRRGKRRRRRRQDRPAISARFLLDERMKGDVGLLSHDLFTELFPGAKESEGNVNRKGSRTDLVRHVAISPWFPIALGRTEDTPWTILPVKPHTEEETPSIAPCTLIYPAASPTLQSFAQALRSISPTKIPSRPHESIEIRILDVVPLGLETIFVTVDGMMLQKLDEIQQKFGGGFGISRANGGVAVHPPQNGRQMDRKTEGSILSQEDRLRDAIRGALQSPNIVHASDLLHLPLPAHPITHVPPQPAKVTMCEPVSQGLLLPSTKIVVIQTRQKTKTLANPTPLSTARLINGAVEEDDDDTSNEQFYSAAEDGNSTLTPSPPENDGETSATEDSGSEISGVDDADLSDDSLEDMLSLTAPSLPPTSSAMLSGMTSATPRAGGGLGTNGISTPGSVSSNFTSVTARAKASTGKIFKAQGLLQCISNELLHPKPSDYEDEEARVFVNVNSLAKIGCFSGDWIKVEAAEEPRMTSLVSWGLNESATMNEDSRLWTVAKVFGLPEEYSDHLPRYAINKPKGSQPGFATVHPQGSSIKAYISPVVLANLGAPSNVRLSPLFPHSPNSGVRHSLVPKRKLPSSSSPPYAKEVTLLKISSPLSTDRSLQPSLLLGLKNYFENKQRIVKSGDLLAITLDTTLGKMTFRGSGAVEGDDIMDELLAGSDGSVQGSTIERQSKTRGVAWFKIDQVVASLAEDGQGRDDTNEWGPVVVVDSTITRMVQAGSQQGKVPGTIDNSWEYYLGVKSPPPNIRSASVGTRLSELPKPQITHIRRRLRELISAATSPRAIHLGLPPIAILLVSTQRNIGKASVASRACTDLGIHSFTIDAYDILTEGGVGGGDIKTEAFLKARSERALSCGSEYVALLLRHVEALNADRMVTAFKELVLNCRILIATTTEVEKVPEGLRSLFTHELEMFAPDEGERESILRDAIEDKGAIVAPDVDLAAIAVKTAALVAGDLVDVVERAIVAKRERTEALARKASDDRDEAFQVSVRDVQVSGGDASRCVTRADFDIAVDSARKNFADSIGAPKIPNVGWDDVGGLTKVKDAVMETIQLPLERPELFAKGMKKRSGILFYGPPGTGKTLLAKAIATEFSLNFFSIKGPELLNMYIGESEANVRRVFQRARDARPCVVFFDELDSVAPKRGNQGDSGGVMDRIVSQLLAELDGISDGEEGGGGVFVIGATNRPDLLDQALLRPGRFDKMLYLGIPDTHDKQLTIMEALTRKFTLHPDTSLYRVAAALPYTYTGADLYALCSDAMLKAITRQAGAVDEKIKRLPGGPVTTAYFFDHLASKEDTSVMVTEEDFFAAQQELVGSVSAKELEHYDHVRRTFESADDKKDENKNSASTTSTISSSHPGTRATDVEPLRPRFETRKSSKGKESARSKVRGKGKAAAHIAGGVNEEEDDEEDDDADSVIRTAHLNGSMNSKGKGKAGAQDGNGGLDGTGDYGFQDASLGDEEDMYS
ncbi:MAG: hypothetical protein M1819_004901 [Sarea resinae]|nr:MAG: hypothetical protein M1819_004901 [Sarea resinae]